MKIETIIAGALFDLMGFLTTRDVRLTLSSADDASPAVEALQQFAAARGLSLDDADVPNWRAALDQPDAALPPLPAPAGDIYVNWGTPQQSLADGYSAAQMDAHARTAWTMGLDCGMQHAPAADETTLPDLARLLGTASKEGKAVKLSPIAAGTLYNAMTTAPAQPATPKLPTTPEEVVAFIGDHFTRVYDIGAVSDHEYTLTVHDLRSAFQNLADFAEVAAQPPAVRQHAAVVYPPDGTVSPFTVINLGTGMVKIGDAMHDGRLPALWFGKEGLGMGVEQVMNRAARPDETLAVITFANVEGLDVLLEVVQRIRGIAFPGAPAAGSAT